MKTKLHLALQALLISLLLLNTVYPSHGQELPAIVRDWAAHAGNSDSTFKTPLSSDTLYTYVASYTLNSGTGADILLVKYDKDGVLQWSKTWSGPGNGRDQATDLVLTADYIYICGFSYSSPVNDYDFVTLCYKKDGSFEWASTHNGPSSGYDGAVAISAKLGGLFVAGVFNNGINSSLDYGLIRYDLGTGAEIWTASYDYNQLMDIPFDLFVNDDSVVTVTGGSQNSIYDWDYATVNFNLSGAQVGVDRVSGTASGFDRALSVKSDEQGAIYITGASAQYGNGYDMKTVKILSNGHLDWQVKEDGDGGDDQGEDVLVDADGNVYVCGKLSLSGQTDFTVMKYDKHGSKQWLTSLDIANADDIARKMCFDQFGNIIATGSVRGENELDFYTIGLDPATGDKVWADQYDGIHGDDQAYDITCDQNGYIYVTGTSHTDNGFETMTLKYRTDYYTSPGQADTPSVAYSYYPNSGQIADTTGNSARDVDYYTLHHYPQLYFQKGKLNMVWSHIDQDTATADTLQRVDVSFLNSGNATKAYPIDEQKEGGYLNYFLAQCPTGITGVYGNQKLLFKDIYSGIDALYSSNNAGLKLYFICGPRTDPSNIGLKFEGQDNL